MRSAGPMRIHVDVTDLVRHAFLNATVTGIQRVQLEAARRIAADEPGARFFSYFAGCFADLTALVRQEGAESTARLFLALRRRFGHPFSPAQPTRHMRDRLANALNFARHAPRRLFRWATPQPVEFGREDLIYVGGAFWADRHCVTLYERASRGGATLAVFLHDAMPIMRPHFTSGLTRPFFERLLRLPLHVLANSHATAAELAATQARVAGARPFLSCRVIALAHEFPGASRCQSALAPASRRLAALADGAPFALCVGTVEIRKNHAALLRLWSRLRAEPGSQLPRLIVAGKRGWMAEAALEILVRARPDGPVQWLEAPSDEELAWLYGRAAFTVFASLAEGWGLPVGESLWFGKPCLASDSPAIREAGGALCLYADPHDIDSFAPPLRRLASEPGFAAAAACAIRASPLRRWAEVGAEISASLSSLARS